MLDRVAANRLTAKGYGPDEPTATNGTADGRLQNRRERLRAEDAEAKRDLDRAQELYSRTVSSTAELDSAKLRYTRAKSAWNVAEARMTIAKKNLMDTELRAPFNGVVTALPAAPGVVVVAECQPRVLVWMRR